jgi:hypothetical protein
MLVRLTVTNAANLLVRENAVLMEISKSAGLLNEGGREAVRVGLVVDKLGVDKLVHLLKSEQLAFV